jgi:hypothetical protein
MRSRAAHSLVQLPDHKQKPCHAPRALGIGESNTTTEQRWDRCSVVVGEGEGKRMEGRMNGGESNVLETGNYQLLRPSFARVSVPNRSANRSRTINARMNDPRIYIPVIVDDPFFHNAGDDETYERPGRIGVCEM